ncbi:MAG: UDP-N-acetylglucosamine 1-carboxyvinyltransferase [Lachnospiraceae bacterium]|nr:UDP-N-acetylglucosamine 1-carboxyvinyltransferase [Lachnospiraceae bacterium]
MLDSIRIRGGNPLFGETKIQGSKNAVLPIMAAALLIKGVSVIENCPNISDVDHMLNLLKQLGCVVQKGNRSLHIDASNVAENTLSSKSVTEMRSSIMLVGAMLGRLGKVVMNYPGGCVIGTRPIDIHLDALQKMGVTIQERKEGEDKYFTATVDEMSGTFIKLPFPSVGATENVILAAINAKGTTILRNAATEPEITALCDFLIAAGAEIMTIEDEGENTIIIKGGCRLEPVCFKVPADRIVAGTYVLAVLGAGGHVFLEDAPVSHMKSVIDLAKSMGADVNVCERGIVILADSVKESLQYLETGIYPHFPTDLQSPLLAILTIAEGKSVIHEKIFEDRMLIVDELNKMGANITATGNEATITGVDKLIGTTVKAKELRGGAALVIAGIIAEGETTIENRNFIKRGYEDIVRDFCNLGVVINNG